MEWSVENIRRIEREARLRGIALMPRAGLAGARFAAARLDERLIPDRHAAAIPGSAPPPATVLALAGPGNNGGDAMVAATWLRAWGHAVRVVLYADPDRLPADARQAYEGWVGAGGEILHELPADAPVLALDGLFGIGLNRPLGALWQARIDALNAWRIPVLALDVPSGLDAATGQALGRPVQATWTLSFIAAAAGLGHGDGPAVCGACFLDTLGLQAWARGQATRMQAGRIQAGRIQANFRYRSRPRPRAGTGSRPARLRVSPDWALAIAPIRPPGAPAAPGPAAT